MKKIIAIVLFLLLLIGLYACGKDDVKQDIFSIVEENEYLLIDAINTGEYETIYNIKGITDITVDDNYIVFYCSGKGIAPSSQEYGFYYSMKNQPIAIFDGKHICEPEDMKEKDNGYEYIDTSYNRFYTEKIIGSFYYYDNSF